MHIKRIDHGNSILDDSALTERVAKSGMALTVCPLYNLRLKVVEELKEHTLRKMFEQEFVRDQLDDRHFWGVILKILGRRTA